MTEYINRDQAIKITWGMRNYTGIDETPYEYADNNLRAVPSANVIEREKIDAAIEEIKSLGYEVHGDVVVSAIISVDDVLDILKKHIC